MANKVQCRIHRIVVACSIMLISMSTGCVTFTKHAVPASRLPNQFRAPSKCNLHPINFQLLSGPTEQEHLLDSGDTLGVMVQGILPPKGSNLEVITSNTGLLNRLYYPPGGLINSPGSGAPFLVNEDGSIHLPQIDPINVRGLTLQQAAQRVVEQYVEKDILKSDSAQVNLSLLKSRVNRIVVLREDASLESANTITRGNAILHKRGSGLLIDLPANECDVLHALAGSGGLPGVDAYNEIWVLRKEQLGELDSPQVNAIVESTDPGAVLGSLPPHVRAIRIPLKQCPGEPISFSPEDVVLHHGDILYVEPRRDEYFYVGGLLPGGQYPLPRDEDLDIIEAIALATGSVGGLGGTSSVAVLRSGAGLGNIVPPTRVLVLRKLPNGQQVPIRVDLNLAMKDSSERIKIMSGDYIMMYYKPGEMASNAFLNLFNFNLTGNIK